MSRVVLVGLPGAGKTTVGGLLAKRLSWRFVDPDDLVRSRTGLDIAAIFKGEGERAFREYERVAMEEALRGERVVIAPGGGWAAQPGAYEQLPEDAVVVWLQVAPVEGARRIQQDEVERPMLAQGDMVVRLSDLEGERMLAYAQAGIVVNTDGRTPEAVAQLIADRLASEYGFDGGSD